MTKITDLARQSAADGVVLLKNTDQVLPLLRDENIAVFGRCQFDYYRSGTGSGGAVNTPYTINLVEGLSDSPVKLNEILLDEYKSWLLANPFDDGGGGWAAEPWYQKEMPLEDDFVKSISKTSDKAVVIIGRTAGEDQDNKNVGGSYKLTTLELEMLKKVTSHFDQVIVLLNVSNIIDMSWDNDQIKGLMMVWHGGMEGGHATADVLCGRVTPNGKLTDTIAYSLEDYPSNKGFGSKVENIYEEDIYIGYRYFNTFKPEAVQYGFGFGLSYTDFDIKVLDASIESMTEETLKIKVKVTNTGAFSGREIVQLYYSAPQGQLGKPAKELGAFIKSSLLKSGASEEMTLEFKLAEMASYDDLGLTGVKSAYVLEQGIYDFYLGNSLDNASKLSLSDGSSYQVKTLTVVEQLSEVMAPVKSFKRFKPGKLQSNGTYELTYEAITGKNRLVNIQKSLPEVHKKISETLYTLEDVVNKKVSMESFVGQMTTEELSTLVKGEGMCSPKATAGTAAAFGGVSKALQQYGLPVAACADGPSGIRMDSGQEATQVAIGTALACTWDVDLVEALYEQVGLELVKNDIDTLLGPGLNIHRHPLNGRNFEYFSEDPFVTGVFASAVVKGLRRGGSIATLKHFVANDQEMERHTVDAIVSERALREINLKGFEIAVKEGGAISMMTSYNPINGIYAASNYELNTTILREEWGFDGIVMTDWWAKVNHPENGGLGEVYHKSYMINAQNDLYMVVPHDQAQKFENDDFMTAIQEGTLSIGELQRSAINICKFLLKTLAFKTKKAHTSYRFFNSKDQCSENITYQVSDVISIEELDEKILTVKVEESKEYKIEVTMRYRGSSLAQASYNLNINDEFGVTVQLNGSDTEWLTRQICEIELEKGYYTFKFDFLRPGIEVKSIKII